MRIAQYLLLASLVLGSAISAAAQSDAVPTTPFDWLVYRDEANGISFRYPPSLKVVKPSLEHMHVPGLVSVVRLRPADEPNLDWLVQTALTMTVIVCGAPSVPCLDETRLRPLCHSFEQFPIGNAEAFQCVDFGSAACHWRAQVNREKLRIGIGAPSAGYEINGRTHGRKECAKGMREIRTLDPIKGILASFVFDK